MQVGEGENVIMYSSKCMTENHLNVSSSFHVDVQIHREHYEYLCDEAESQQLSPAIYWNYLGNLPYVYSKFVQKEAVGIYYIPWPAEKLLPKIPTQTCLP